MKTMQAFLKRSQACGFTSLSQVRVFLTLGEQGTTTARHIADATGMEAAMVSGVLKSLSDWTLVDLEKKQVISEGQKRWMIFATLSNRGEQALDMMQMEVSS